MQQDIFLLLLSCWVPDPSHPLTAAACDFNTFSPRFGEEYIFFLDPSNLVRTPDCFWRRLVCACIRAHWYFGSSSAVLRTLSHPRDAALVIIPTVSCWAKGALHWGHFLGTSDRLTFLKWPKFMQHRLFCLLCSEHSRTPLYISFGFCWDKHVKWHLHPISIHPTPSKMEAKAVVGQDKSMNLLTRGEDSKGRVVKMYIFPSELRQYLKLSNGNWLLMKASKVLKNRNLVSHLLSAPHTLKCITMEILFLCVPLQMTPGKHWLLPVGFFHHPFPGYICIYFQICNHISLTELWGRIYVTPFRSCCFEIRR